jgi:acyl carrier protein
VIDPMARNTVEPASIREAVRAYLIDVLSRTGRRTELTDDDDLLQVLDSLHLLRMVLELESRHGISIDNSELTPENLGTVARIASFVERKRSVS